MASEGGELNILTRKEKEQPLVAEVASKLEQLAPEPPMLTMIRRQRLERLVAMNAMERQIKEDERWISYLERHPEALEFAEFIKKIPQ
jgi:hypothetical protein